eukprot:COSAG04_NODE_20122_length_400_cov_0.850498_1_plen_104_part_00
MSNSSQILYQDNIFWCWDQAYELSQASADTLAQQGGPLSSQGLSAFLSAPGSDVALRLRTYDDLGKVSGREVPQLESYREPIYDHLRAQSAAPIQPSTAVQNK